MNKILKYIWFILVILTTFTYLVGSFKVIGTLSLWLLLLTTFIKGVLISDYFMGLKNVAGKYRFIPIIWLSVVILLISIFTLKI